MTTIYKNLPAAQSAGSHESGCCGVVIPNHAIVLRCFVRATRGVDMTHEICMNGPKGKRIIVVRSSFG